MQIVIDNKEKKYDENFFPFLLKYTKQYLRLSCDYRKLEKFEEYLNEDTSQLGPFKKRFSAREIFISAVFHLTITKSFNDVYIIEVDPNVLYAGTQLNLSMLARTLNYGSTGYVGYPIFTDSFSYVKRNLDNIYLLYERTN